MSTSPYLRHAARMLALVTPLRGLDAAGLADRGLCLARWRRAGLVDARSPDLATADVGTLDLRMPDLEEEREARRRALIYLRLFPGSVVPERSSASQPLLVDARSRFAGLRAFAALGRELAGGAAQVVHG